MTVASLYCSGSGSESSAVGYNNLMVNRVRWGTARVMSVVSRPVQARLMRVSRVTEPLSSGV